MLLPFPEAVDFLNKMARRARKRNVSLAIVSQRFQDFYEKPEAQAVLTSVSYTHLDVYKRQETGTVAENENTAGGTTGIDVYKRQVIEDAV